MLIMTDGTPHDWFQNGNTASLHMTLDDDTDKILSGYFMPTECQLGYCHAFKLMLEKMVFHKQFIQIEQRFYGTLKMVN